MQDDTQRKKPDEFTAYMMRSSLFSMRTGLLVTLCLFIMFPLLNYYFFPNRIEQQFFIRFGIILPFILLSVCVLYFKIFWSHIELYLTLINALVSVSVFFVGYHTSADVAGYNYFFIWTMLVLMGNSAFYRIRFRNFIGVITLLLVSYLSATILNGSFSYDPFTFANNLFFVLCMASIGFFVSWNIYQLNRDNFTRQKALERNYNELKEETRVRNEVEKDLDHSEQRYATMLDTIPDSIAVIDAQNNLIMANMQLLRINKMFGLETEIIGKNLFSVYPFLPAETETETAGVFKSGQQQMTTQHFDLGGQHYITETRKIPILNGKQVEKVMLIIRDVTRERSYEELKLRNAEQKELLLREIHHRVKNNLAIVISMLSLQARSNPDPVLTGIIQDIELRIRSMALIHEHLYRSETLDRIPLAEYLKSLSAVVSSTFQGPNIQFNTRLDPIDSDIEAALPIGLIANELLTNAFKYAFPSGSKGNITLTLRQIDGEQIEMAVIDDGVGLPEHFSMEEQSTLGMFMVRLLIEQLYGKLTILKEKGTTFRITFNHKLI